jgi:hypothetical protein
LRRSACAERKEPVRRDFHIYSWISIPICF